MTFAPSYGLITGLDEVATRAAAIAAAKTAFGFDIETGYDGEAREKASLHPEENFISGISFAGDLTWARYVPLRHDTGVNLDNQSVAEILWPLFHVTDDEGLPLGVAHGAIFELRVMARWFLRLLWDHPVFGPQVLASHGYFPVRSCTLLESFTEGENQRHGLKDMIFANYGHKMAELLDLFPEGLTKKEQRSIRFSVLDQHRPDVVSYACEDSLWALHAHLDRWPRVRGSLVYKTEMAVLYVVAEMCDEGLVYDWNFLREGSRKAHDFADRFQAEVLADFSALAGEDISINLNSSAQLGDVLYGKCGMPVRKWTDGGKSGIRKPSVDAKIALKGLSKQYEAVAKLLKWKGINTLCNNFLDKYERDFTYAPDNRAHPGLLQHGTITGRFSAEGPNYQQSPKKYKVTMRDGSTFEINFRDSIRAPFAGSKPWWAWVLEDYGYVYPDPGQALGWYILGFDYSQIELRVFAGESGETALIEAFKNGQDVHKLTAALMLGKALEDVTKDDRDIGKAQPTYEQVLTPRGWVRMDSLRAGSQVIGSNGQPTRVRRVYPQEGRKPMFEVRFSDGSAARCCDEHYWTVGSRNWSGPKTLQLSEIRKSLRWGKEYRYWVETVAPVEMEPEDLPLDPYLLGLLLGDGSFRGRCVSYTSADEELVDAAQSALEPLGLGLYPKGGYDYYVTGHGRQGRGSVGPLMQALRDVGLWGLDSHRKFVPGAYLRGRSADRLALLQGLLDTDGCVSAAGAEFSSSSERLADDVVALARSLGGTARKAPHQHGTAWRVYIRLRGLTPFRLKRKADSYKPSPRPLRRKIVSVEPVTPCLAQCISVEAPDGLYVTRDYVVTHNTMNFALAYGMTEEGLADRLGITVEEAHELFAQYHAAYPHMRTWTEQTVAQSRRDGYVTTRFGRKVRIWEYDSPHRWVRRGGERTAGNAPIQGSATGDYAKIAMVRAQKALKAAGLEDRVRLFMNVHDALEWYVRKDVSPAEVIQVLQDAVVFPIDGWPPMLAAWHMGERWGSVRELEVLPDGSLRVVPEDETDVPVAAEVEDGEEDELDKVKVSSIVRTGRGEPPPGAHYPEEVAGATVLRELFGPETGPAPADATPRTVIVQLSASPTEREAANLMALLQQNPGPNTVVLRIPEGDVPVAVTSSLAPRHEPQVSVIFGGAIVAYDLDSVDTDELARGLDL